MNAPKKRGRPRKNALPATSVVVTRSRKNRVHIISPIVPVTRAQTDMINQPPHYTHGEIECIDAMIAAFGIEAVRTYCRIAAFKYQWRADHKGAALQDLEKAVWYLRFAAGNDPRTTDNH